MALLQLKDIGKIYVSGGVVSVGIRGVNLSFDRGEFVAVTGKSGSGKSTLLNVISGMDTYEEGELFISGSPTSHYRQSDWESYRQQYISFIFQDYNVIESFTVLQNVELSLMHIRDRKARRLRAKELIARVGLTSHLHQKGSRLSGGQKQRTVIARALAKDSPVILADEPTGNLDASTSSEILSLLHEVSSDRLVIVVTHSFDQVSPYATRHIRIFDGSVESDVQLKGPGPEGRAAVHGLRDTNSERENDITGPVAVQGLRDADSKNKNGVSGASQNVVSANSETVSGGASRSGKLLRRLSRLRDELRNGFSLGGAVFSSRPKLTLFLCLLMAVGTLGIFFVTSLCGSALSYFDDHTMFTPLPGRLVLTRRDGGVFSPGELESLSSSTGASSLLRYDLLLDSGSLTGFVYGEEETTRIPLSFRFGEDYGSPTVGRYPTRAEEVFLCLPLEFQPLFGKRTLLIDKITVLDLELTVSGVKYFIDNNKPSLCLLTEEGFSTLNALYFLRSPYNDAASFVVTRVGGDGRLETLQQTAGFLPSFSVAPGKLYLFDSSLRSQVGTGSSLTVSLSSRYIRYDYSRPDNQQAVYRFDRDFGEEYFLPDNRDLDLLKATHRDPDLLLALSPSLIRDTAEEVLSLSYRQASLFYPDNASASAAAEILTGADYIAVPANTTYSPDVMSTLSFLIEFLVMGGLWFLSILFLSFFIHLCSSHAVGASKSDLAILRSMGIPVKVIRLSTYVRMLLSLLPALILLFLSSCFIFHSPTLNPKFVYLYPWQYALIVLGTLLLTLRVTHKQLRRLFGESVKKSLRGGASE